MSEPLRLWSVTTLAKIGLGTSDPLVNWAVMTTAGAAYDKIGVLEAFVKEGDREGAVNWLKDQRWQKSGQAAARGTDLHTAAEALALGQKPEVEDHILPYVHQYQQFLHDFRPTFLMAEAPVYHPTLGYAGTCDGILELDGQRLLFDLKTTDKAPDSGKSRPPYAEVALQMAAYRNAEWVGVLSEMRYASGKRYYIYDPDAAHEPMPETDGAICIVISPYDYMVVPVRTDAEVFKHFRHVMECARWQVTVSRNVFGPPIGAPTREVTA